MWTSCSSSINAESPVCAHAKSALGLVGRTIKLSDHWPTVTLGGKETVSKPECNEAAERASGSLKRMVRRQRCGHCAHLKSEHIPNSLCWEEAHSYWEEVMLPVCIYCAATCDDEEDEMCQTCWNARLKPNKD